MLAAIIDPGTSSGSPGEFTLFDGQVFFSGWPSSFARELWRHDGNGQATMVRDIRLHLCSQALRT